MTQQLEYAPEGFLYMRVVTPKVAEEYLIPVGGFLIGEYHDHYERLQDLADIHRTSIHSSPYRTL